MKVISIRHKGLRRFVTHNDPSGLPPMAVEKIRHILSFLFEMDSVDELRAIPGWWVHLLGADRKGTWSLTVTRNWRITFTIDAQMQAIADLDYEDYH